MFLAVIIPPARKDRIILGLVAVSFAASYAASVLPWIGSLSSGTRIIILTIVLAAGAAVLFPHPAEEPGGDPGTGGAAAGNLCTYGIYRHESACRI